MGRGYVGLAALAASLVVVSPAAAGLTFHEFDHGKPYEIVYEVPVAFVAASSEEAQNAGVDLRPDALAAISRVDFTRNLVVVVFAGWGCKQHQYTVSTVTRLKRTLYVSLKTKPMPAGTDCATVYATYRSLAVPKAQLARPYPTKVQIHAST